jgi:DNA (cytosine-5)-methyltransferase 1
LADAIRHGTLVVGTAFKRMRKDAGRSSIQRTEIRFDGIAGCLRTPAGGSSRQILLAVEGEDIRSRLLSPRESARLMGLEDSYQLPLRGTDAAHLLGDGVAVPVVRFLTSTLLEKIATQETESKRSKRKRVAA